MADWWQEFFATAWSRIQSGGYAADRTSAECDLIERSLGLPRGARLLDVPCGIGRNSVELAKRGYRLTGVDLRPEYVAQAEAAAAEARVEARFAVGDMRELASEQKHDAAFCYFGSFGYFNDSENLRFARAVVRALAPTGRFLIEGHIAETLLPVFRERDWFWAGSERERVRVLEERTWDLDSGRVESTWTLAGDAGLSALRISIRVYTYRELKALLESAGFSRVRALDGKTGEPFAMGAARAIVVASKASAV